MFIKHPTPWYPSILSGCNAHGNCSSYTIFQVLDANRQVVCEVSDLETMNKIIEAVNFKELYDDRAKYPKDVSQEILRMKERIEKLEKAVNTETDPRWSGAGSLKGYPVSSSPEQETYSRWVGMGGSQGYTLAPESMKKEESFAYKKGETVFFVGVSTFEVYEGTVEKDVPHYSRGVLIRPVEIEKFGGLPHEVSSFLVFRTYNEAYKYANS